MVSHVDFLVIFGLLAYFDGCLAQLSVFQWKFGNNVVSTTLEECQSYQLIVQNRTDNASDLGVPPYYVTAFVPGGIPTTSLVGSDPTNLTWTLNQPAGASFLLSMADSNQSAGGLGPVVYTSAAGQSTACLPPAPSTNITITSNITSTLTTCQPLGLRVYGGQQPYTVHLAAVGSPVVTNVTMGPTDDVFTYIDRADPNGQLLAAVTDATGTWGTGTQLLSTVGSSDTNCTGLISTSGNSSSVNQHPTTPSSTNHTGLIVGVVVGVVAFVLAVVTLFVLRRRRKLMRERQPEPAFIPEAWSPPEMQAEPFASRPGMPATPSKQSYAFSGRPGSSGTDSQLEMPRMSTGHYTAVPSSSSDPPSPPASSAGLPLSKAEMARGARGHPPGLAAGWRIEPNIVIQHQDGGVVQEIPPPYADRNQPSGSGSRQTEQ